MAHQPVNHLGPARIATSTPLKPKFEGVVSTSTLKRVAAEIIEFSIAVEEVVGDVGVVAQPSKDGRVFDEKRTANQGDTHHFVGVPTHAVSLLNTVHELPMFG